MAYDARTGTFVADEPSVLPGPSGGTRSDNWSGGGGNPPPRNDYVGQDDYKQKGPDKPDGRDPKRPGETDEQYKDRVKNSDFDLAGGPVDAPRGLSPAEAAAIIKQFGLTGLSKLNLEGLSLDQAKEIATKKKQELLGAATLDNVSSFYDVTQLDNIKKSTDYLMSSLNEVKNNPWSTSQDKTMQIKSLVNNATAEYAKMFNTPEDFIKAYQTDPAFTNAMKSYINAGGTVADVSKRIAAQTAMDLPSQQSTAEYLAATKYRPQAVDQAEAALTGERSATIDEINRLAKVPQEYRDLYYGTPEAIGYFTKVKEEADATIANLNKAYEQTKQSTSEQFDLEISRQRAQADRDVADLEEKRLQSKNYLIGKLANIGALTTSGEAPKALSDLDARYESSKTSVRNSFNTNQATLVSKKNQAINELDTDLQDKISKIESSVDKTELEIEKEIQSVTEKSEEKKKAAIDKYNSASRTVYRQYLNEANKNAKDYVKEYYKTVSGGISNKYISSLTGTIKNAKGKKSTGGGSGSYTSGGLKYTAKDIADDESYLRTQAGSDGKVPPAVYKAAHDQWVKKGGLVKDFVAKFPPKTWVNAAGNAELPDVLKAPSTSTTKKTTTTNTRSLK